MESNDPSEAITFRKLTLGPGRACKESLLLEIRKLKTIRHLELPADLLSHVPTKMLKRYRMRAVSEELRELRRHQPPVRYSLFAAFFWSRAQEITDSLVELLITIVHNIRIRSERKVERELLHEVKRVRGKRDLLVQLLEATLGHPDGIIGEVLYSVVDPETLLDLLKELKYTQLVYKEKVYVKMRASYSQSYRRALADLLEILTFRSNNEIHRPVLAALKLVKQYIGTNQKYFPVTDEVPIEGVIRPMWRETVLETDPQGRPRVNRINYEICVFHALRDQLRCKEIWVVGADRYRNPEEDLPDDFEARRQEHYHTLQQPLDADAFIAQMKKAQHAALSQLNQGLPRNKKVAVTPHKGGWISVSPLEAQPEPKQLSRLKQEIARRWWMVKLIDLLKEADLRVGFTDAFQSLATHERLDRKVIQKRLLLCLYGLGTNMGLKRVAAGNPDVTYKDLLYIKRKFIHRDNVKGAIAEVVNHILKERLEEVWGEATTSCASDSKKFGAWDQNLMTEWHIRYRGRGVMVYWHVEEKSACIYSQLKTCSSSEVAAMIEGLLRHCTDKDVEKNYVDTHGQSEVAFAFCHLLNFQLMPRFKNIGSQRLYKPEAGSAEAYPNLQPVLAKNPIRWDLIWHQYDQMVKYATALRLGTAETEAILKRFQQNRSHPTYQALSELGKVVKTIFTCNPKKSAVKSTKG
ncbi:Tn3 family transposase [Melghirimyces algeriensis]|uniref:Transposase and inactivated derivatives, TnpA family n=1 Tax=Melghirimyces algeriensis TaxID=910412 RepID=A0A521CEF6_9BACL|nr:Transposase and inactivated derivatives, TnpA family [Melghirimyces algeriensis]